MSFPKITVLMALYNGGHYLKMSIQSVLLQTYHDFEFLIINDCSTDDSLAVIESFKDDRIIVCTNEKNIGQTASLNKGLRLAQGKYIARMDADDIAYSQWLKVQLDFLEKNNECAVVSTKAIAINKDGQKLRILNTPINSEEILLKSIFFSPINHVGCLMKKDIILEEGGYDGGYKIAADYDLWSRLLRKGYRLACTSSIGVEIRLHEASISMVEHEKSGITEISRIIEENIKGLSGFLVEGKQASDMFHLGYSVDCLSFDDFVKALRLLKEIYVNVQVKYNLEQKKIYQIFKNNEKFLCIKRIFGSIKNKEWFDVRKVSQFYMSENGYFNQFFIVWILSYSVKRVLVWLPSFYVRMGAVKVNQVNKL